MTVNCKNWFITLKWISYLKLGVVMMQNSTFKAGLDGVTGQSVYKHILLNDGTKADVRFFLIF